MSNDHNRTTVLIVDDDLTIRASVLDLLRVEGYHVLSASDGLEALGILQRLTPDLIISDISMPTMDGYAFLKAVRSNASWTLIPFIFLSARNQAHDIREGVRLGVDQYLVKPFEPDDLLVAIEARLKRIKDIEVATLTDVESMKQQLMNTISHELRTPLTHIYGYVSLLREESPNLSPDELKEMVGTIQRGTERLVKLVEDLLIAARLDSGEIALEIQYGSKPVRLDGVVADAVASQSEASEGRGVTIETTLSPETGTIWCEPIHLHDAIARLVENAIKFSRSPGGRVWVSTEKAGDNVKVIVQDDGIGVSLDQQKVMFQKMRQIDRETQEQQGIGMGLTIAQGIIEAHGGGIEVRSNGVPGEGAAFTVWLPASAKA
jgi:signal transduction histidine kinase